MQELLLPLCVGLVFFAACSRMPEQEILSRAKTSRDEAKYTDALGYYRLYLDDYPTGKYRPDVLLKAAGLCGNEMREYQSSIALYKKFYNEYPSHPDAGKALLLIGFMYSEQIKNLDSARYYYTSFIDKYPDNEVTPSIKIELANLGKDPEKILEEKADSDGMAGTSK